MSLSAEESNTSPSQERSASLAGAIISLAPDQLVAGRYRVISLIGEGGMGAVYRVEQVFLRQQFAMKTLSSAKVSDVLWRRFQKEAKTAALLDHTNLVKLRDFGEWQPDDSRSSGEKGESRPTMPFFVMDLAEGETLSKIIKRSGHLQVDDAVEIFIQVAKALAYAHSRGVIHRDIKPSNVIVDDFGSPGQMKVKVVDFGIAKLALADDTDSMALTRTGEIFGTPFYMSPEQCLGLDVDHRADIYSFGCVLFEALTGLPPFIGDGALTTIMKQQKERAPTLKEASLGRAFSDDLEYLVARLLKKEPHDRYENLFHVASDLEKIKQGKPIERKETRQGLRATTRNPLALVSGGGQAAMVVMLLLSVVAFIWGWNSAKKSKPLLAPSTRIKLEDSRSRFDVTDQVLLPSAVTFKSEYFSTFTSDHPGLRYFHFPENESVGRLRDFSAGTKAFAYRDGKLVPVNEAQAIGEVVIDNFQPCEFGPSEQACLKPEYLLKFRADEISGLNLENLPEINDRWLANAARLKSIKTLILTGCRFITDRSIKHINELPNLTALNIYATEITTEGLLKLKTLRQMERLGLKSLTAEPVLKVLKGSNKIQLLYMRHTGLSDNSVALLGTMPNLVVLEISGNDLSDKILPVLTKLHHLRELYLDENQITPAAIPLLSKLPLRKLSISGAGWSEADRERLTKALSTCEIQWEHVHGLNMAAFSSFWDSRGLQRRYGSGR